MRNIRVATLGVALGLVGLVGSVGVVGCGGDPAMEEPVEPVESSDPSTGSLTDNFPGTWELTAVELADATGNPISVPDPPAFGSDGAVGQLIADTDGHLGVAIMQQGRPKYEEPTLEEAVADLDGYAALFGHLYRERLVRPLDDPGPRESRSPSERDGADERRDARGRRPGDGASAE